MSSSINIQVTIDYAFDHGACVPRRVHTVVVSAQHILTIEPEEVRKELMEKVNHNLQCQNFLIWCSFEALKTDFF